jgi:hypothetical protein
VLPVIAGLGVEAYPPISQWLDLVSLVHSVSSKRDGRDDVGAIELDVNSSSVGRPVVLPLAHDPQREDYRINSLGTGGSTE